MTIKIDRTTKTKTGESYVDECPRGDTVFLMLRLPKPLDPQRKKFTFRIGTPDAATMAALKSKADDAATRALREAYRATPPYRRTLAAAVAKRDCMKSLLVAAAEEREARGDARYPITFGEAVDTFCKSSTNKYINDRRSQLQRYACPLIGQMLLASLSFRDINRVLAEAARKKLSKQTVIHLKNSIASVIKDAYKREQIPNLDVLVRVELPDFPASAVDQREREMLTDAEFAKLVNCADVLFELRVMAVFSRTTGGARASDMHALRWEMVDTADWLTCFIPRPKTAKSKKVVHRRHALPELCVRFLKEWWMSKGRPTAGFVFGVRRRRRLGDGSQLGDQRKKGVDYARRLRKALLVAGVTRYELHNETPTSLPCDFHSFRRAFCTGIAAAGVNVQVAMSLAGHSSAATHQRYVLLSEALAVPEAAIPTVAVAVASVKATTG